MISSPKKFLLVCFCLFIFPHFFQAQLNAGDIMFVGYNSDGDDGFALAALAPIPASSTIYISDNNWNGSVFSATEGVITWNVPTIIPAGSVIVFDFVRTTPTVTSGTATRTGTFDPSGTSETLFAYLGTISTPTTFLSSFSNNVLSLANTFVGTGLVPGVNATILLGNPDVCVYVPTLPCVVSILACSAWIANPLFWAVDDGSFDQSNDGGIDFPSSVPLTPSISVLPIELISFEVEELDGKGSKLVWQTASEYRNDYFELERSIDSETWEKIHQVSGVSNSNDLVQYEFTDPFVSNFDIYYRLSQTDIDGIKKSFDVISVRPNMNKLGFNIYPNPSIEVVYIQKNDAIHCEVQLNDLSGRTLTDKVEISKVDYRTIKLNIKNLNSGSYLLFVDGETRTVIKK